MPHLTTCAALLASAGAFTASTSTTVDPALLRFLLQRGGPEYGMYPEDHPNYASWMAEVEERDQDEMDAQMDQLVQTHDWHSRTEPTSFSPDQTPEPFGEGAAMKGRPRGRHQCHGY